MKSTVQIKEYLYYIGFFCLVNFVIFSLWYLSKKGINKKYIEFENFYTYNISLPLNYFQEDLYMKNILKMSEILYNKLEDFKKNSVIYKYNHMNLLLEEQHYNGYYGKEIWDLIFKNCSNNNFKEKNKNLCSILYGYKNMVTMQIGINYNGYINLNYLNKKVFKNFDNIQNILFLYHKLLISLNNSLSIFYINPLQIDKNNSYFLSLFEKNNYTFSNDFYKDFEDIFNYYNLKIIIDNLNIYLQKYYNDFSNSIIIEDSEIYNIENIISKYMKSEDSLFHTLIDLEGLRTMNKYNNISSIINKEQKLTKREFVAFINLFLKVGKCISNFFFVEDTFNQRKLKKRKDNFILNCIFFMIAFFVNYFLYENILEKNKKIKKKKHI